MIAIRGNEPAKNLQLLQLLLAQNKVLQTRHAAAVVVVHSVDQRLPVSVHELEGGLLNLVLVRVPHIYLVVQKKRYGPKLG